MTKYSRIINLNMRAANLIPKDFSKVYGVKRCLHLGFIVKINKDFVAISTNLQDFFRPMTQIWSWIP